MQYIHFLAPEVLEKDEYSKASDMWSVGIILHLLLYGSTPFNQNINFKQIK